MTDVDIEFDMDDELEVIAEIDLIPVAREPFEALYARMFDRMRRLAYVLVGGCSTIAVDPSDAPGFEPAVDTTVTIPAG